MKLSEIINEMIDIKIDQELEKHCDSRHKADGIRCGDPRPERLEELGHMIDRMVNQTF